MKPVKSMSPAATLTPDVMFCAAPAVFATETSQPRSRSCASNGSSGERMITNSLRPASGAVTDKSGVSAAVGFASGDFATIVVPRLALVSCAGSSRRATQLFEPTYWPHFRPNRIPQGNNRAACESVDERYIDTAEGRLDGGYPDWWDFPGRARAVRECAGRERARRWTDAGRAWVGPTRARRRSQCAARAAHA
ncbi:hypothetical protein BVIET440_30150 [Burkholderia vietnamiensis]